MWHEYTHVVTHTPFPVTPRSDMGLYSQYFLGHPEFLPSLWLKAEKVYSGFSCPWRHSGCNLYPRINPAEVKAWAVECRSPHPEPQAAVWALNCSKSCIPACQGSENEESTALLQFAPCMLLHKEPCKINASGRACKCSTSHKPPSPTAVQTRNSFMIQGCEGKDQTLSSMQVCSRAPGSICAARKWSYHHRFTCSLL